MTGPLYNLAAAMTRQRAVSALLIGLLFAGLGMLASNIRLEEDITKLVPASERNQEVEQVLRSVRFTDKIVIHISQQDSGSADDLAFYADQLLGSLSTHQAQYVQNVKGRFGDDDLAGTMALVQEHLPHFLNEQDLQKLAQRLQPDSIASVNRNNFRLLNSPSGMVAKKNMRSDPFGLTFVGLKKLQELGISDDLTVQSGYLMSEDLRHLLLFITPTYSTDKTAENTPFVEALERYQEQFDLQFRGRAQMEFFGAPLVAVANAQRIKKDIQRSVTIAVAVLLLLLMWFFRRIAVAVILFVPSLFGGLLALCVLYLVRTEVSGISLGIGSVILGVTLDYSLHILTHLRERNDLKALFKEVAGPVLVSGLTTASAFLCLWFIHSQALQDLGLFCAVAVIGASVFALLFIPLAYRPKVSGTANSSWLDRLAAYPLHKNKLVFWSLILLMIVSAFTYSKVGFNEDLSALNYMPSHLQAAQDHLDQVTSAASRSIYVVAHAQDRATAADANRKVYERLKELKASGSIKDFSSVALLMPSPAEQQHNLARWDGLWSDGKKDSVRATLVRSGAEVGFRENTYEPFFDRLAKGYGEMQLAPDTTIGPVDLSEFISEEGGMHTITSLVNVDPQDMAQVRDRFSDMPNVITIDREATQEGFLGDLQKDFNRLILYSMIVVTLILLLYFRSGMLTLVTGLPILLTWLLTIGIMGLLDLQLNIFNIIVCTFIFGLGIDYSVFMTQGLLHELRTGRDHLRTHKTSILLSVITTLLGIGVLIFAKHPALRSISLVSIIGILAAMLVSFVIQPRLFKLFIGVPGRRPVSLREWLMALFSFGYFFLGVSLFAVAVTVLKPFRGGMDRVKVSTLQKLMSKFKKSVLYTNPFVKKRLINEHGEDFSKPAVLVANHTSMLDILVMGMLSDKIMFLTNDWVHNAPVFGKVVREAGGYLVTKGLDQGMGYLEHMMKNGRSIMVFPEGTRSYTNDIKRFRKGAFMLAHQFQVDVIPVLIAGPSEVLPKDHYVIRDGRIDIKILPRIQYGSQEFGTDARDTTKKVSRLLKQEFLDFRREIHDAKYFHEAIRDDYKYRERERYREVKRWLNEHAEELHQLTCSISIDANVLHLSQRGGPVDLLLAMDGPRRTIRSYIADENERLLISNTAIIDRYGRIKLIDDPQNDEAPNADVIIVEQGFDHPVLARLSDRTILHHP